MKKLFTFLLALVASVGMTFAAITVRLNPSSCSNWKEVRLWAWTENGDVFNTGWPGPLVDKDINGWYSYTFDASITSVNILWNNGNDQTIDITNVSVSTCFALIEQTGGKIGVNTVDCTTGQYISTIVPPIDNVQIGDLYYYLSASGNTAEVRYCKSKSSSVTIPSSVIYNGVSYTVTRIGNEAFYWNSSLTSITIPNSVTSIGDRAFEDCSSLTSITIPNSVTSIGSRAFYNCDSLTSVTIGESLTSIGNEAFYWCTSLTSITIPNSLTSIGERAFNWYFSLTSVTLTASSEEDFCKGQGNSLLYTAGVKCRREIQINGNKVTDFTIPNSVTRIGELAFYGCKSLTSVTIPNSVDSIGEDAFSNCSLNSVTLTAPSEEDFCKGQKNSLLYSAGVYCHREIQINGNKVTDFTIPNSVTSIGKYAFAYCSSLTSITIPNSVTSIGWGAFAYCSSLTSITIPNRVTSIGKSAFYGCSSLSSMYVESETPPIIGMFVFYYYDYNRSDDNQLDVTIYVPCGTLDAYKNAEGWSDYASIIRYAPYSSYNINKKAENGHITTSSTDIFTMCDTEHPVICTATPDRGYYFVRWADGNTENPRTIELTQDTTMEAIFDYLLEGKCGKDSALTWTFDPASMSLDISGTGELTENYTYGTFVKTLTIGNSVTSIGSSAFDGCSSLTSVTIGNSVTSIGRYAFYNCSSLTSITIPNSVTSIGEYAFYNCSSLASITIPNCVTSIGSRAFYGCSSLTSITIPNSVTSIGKYAFYGCNKLVDVYCYATTPPVTENESTFTHYNAFLYVPCESKKAYMVDAVWGNFKYIECISTDNVTTDEIVVTPSENEANVIWPSVNGAASYELVIKDKDGNIVCTLIFNANGQLTSIAFNAPSRNGAPAQTQNAGFSFTITGLDSGTGYELTLTAKDNSGNAIQTETISFITTGGNVSTDIDQLQGHKVQSTKVIKDGQVLILRNGKTYTMQGQEVK